MTRGEGKLNDLPYAKVFKWDDIVVAIPDQIISLAVAETNELDFTLFSFGAGESISTEIVNANKFLLGLVGELDVEYENHITGLGPNQTLLLNEGTHHAITAKTNASFLQIHRYQLEEDQPVINKIPHNETLNLTEQIEVLPNKKASKALVQRKDLTLTLFALDEGQQIAKHTATGDALVQILEGEARITIAEEDHVVKAGECIVMPAEIPHALEATTAFKMLLTVVKGGD